MSSLFGSYKSTLLPIVLIIIIIITHICLYYTYTHIVIVESKLFYEGSGWDTNYIPTHTYYMHHAGDMIHSMRFQLKAIFVRHSNH